MHAYYFQGYFKYENSVFEKGNIFKQFRSSVNMNSNDSTLCSGYYVTGHLVQITLNLYQLTSYTIIDYKQHSSL